MTLGICLRIAVRGRLFQMRSTLYRGYPYGKVLAQGRSIIQHQILDLPRVAAPVQRGNSVISITPLIR